jgi:hypothetical protein
MSIEAVQRKYTDKFGTLCREFETELNTAIKAEAEAVVYVQFAFEVDPLQHRGMGELFVVADNPRLTVTTAYAPRRI